MEILDFFKKKQSKYLLTLLILNNINAGCKKKCGKEGNNDTKKKQNSTQSSGQNDGQENPKEEKPIGENPDPEKETEEEKKKKLEEEEKKRKEKLEEERLNKIVSEVKKFFNVLNKVYVNNKTQKKETDKIIKAEIVEDKIKDFIKYLESIDFSKDVQDDDIEIFIKLLSIVKIEGCNEDLNTFHNNLKNTLSNKGDLYKLYTNNQYSKYFEQLFSGDSTDYNFLIIKDKLDNKIYFAIKTNGESVTINNKRYDIISLSFNTLLRINYLKQSIEEKDKISDAKMDFVLKLAYNNLLNLPICFNYFDKILAHIGDISQSLPKDIRLGIYKLSEEKVNNNQVFVL